MMFERAEKDIAFGGDPDNLGKNGELTDGH
jgi:hypothetical protein